MIIDETFYPREGLEISDEEAREIIRVLTGSYKLKKLKGTLYSGEDYIPENIILIYLYYVMRSKYKIIMESYKKEFIYNESLVEPGVTVYERVGLGVIYDYIQDFDFDKDNFNIFVTSILIHCHLYSKCPFPDYGGKLRDATAFLKDSFCDVPPAEEARREFQSYLSKKIILDPNNIFAYIDECVKTTVDLIRLQPFPDGNKRTFRALLNLMLKKLEIPPIFIEVHERAMYKKQLLKALVDYDYTGITRFYYYKICDAITDLDVNKTYKEDNTETVKKFIMTKYNKS